jgi:hypothetical protein
MQFNTMLYILFFFFFVTNVNGQKKETPTLLIHEVSLSLDSSEYIDSIHFKFEIKGDLPIFYVMIRSSSMGSYASFLVSKKFIPFFENGRGVKFETHVEKYPHGMVLLKKVLDSYTATLPFRGYNLKLKKIKDIILVPYYAEDIEGERVNILEKDMSVIEKGIPPRE